MAITYNRTDWQNKVTPVNETNMNNIEQGIVDCVEAINNGSGSTITIDDTLSDTSENPVQNKVINTALDTKINKTSTDEGFWFSSMSGARQIEKTNSFNDIVLKNECVAMADDVNDFVHSITDNKLDCTTITLTTTTNDEHITELLTYIRGHQATNTIAMYYISVPINFTHSISATDTTPAYSMRATIASAFAVLYRADGTVKINSIYADGGSVTVDSTNAITAITPTNVTAFDYNDTATYRPVALNTMKLYVANAPDTISVVADNACTFDFSKGQMLTANVEVSANTTLTFGVDGNNNAEYIGRTISACITNTSTSAARTITFTSPTGITRVVGVENGSADSLSIPALKTVKLDVTLLKTVSGFVAYIEYKQIN